jgi:hypothetical protein
MRLILVYSLTCVIWTVIMIFLGGAIGFVVVKRPGSL